MFFFLGCLGWIILLILPRTINIDYKYATRGIREIVLHIGAGTFPDEAPAERVVGGVADIAARTVVDMIRKLFRWFEENPFPLLIVLNSLVDT